MSTYFSYALQTCFGRRQRRVQDHHAEQAAFDVSGHQNQQGMRARSLGGTAARVGLLAEQEPGERQHPEREASAQEHHQLFLRSTHRVPDLRVAFDHQLRGNQRAVVQLGRRLAESNEDPEFYHQLVPEVRVIFSILISFRINMPFNDLNFGCPTSRLPGRSFVRQLFTGQIYLLNGKIK